MDWEREVEIKKTDPEKRLVFGFLSVAKTADGEEVEDSQGDIIEEAELEEAAYDHVLYARKAGEMHQRIGIGRLVESMVFTVEKQEVLGIPPGSVPVGWWTGFRIDDDQAWEGVKSGKYTAFSIGGKARREEV